jgi:metallo-beta-lactamase class B
MATGNSGPGTEPRSERWIGFLTPANTLETVNHTRVQLAVLMLLATAGALSAQSDWDEPFPPHRIADNLYYVGSKGLATYLITTPKGHILINSSFERTVPIIRGNVEKLGFKFTDIKILLASHAHSDHVAGHALIKELIGARVEVMEGDAKVIATGGKGQYLYTEDWKPCAVDRVLKDGDTVTLGEATLTARPTPGHTRGCTTWIMQAADGGKSRNVVIIGSPNVNPGYQLITNRDYPEIADDFTRTFRLLKSLP